MPASDISENKQLPNQGGVREGTELAKATTVAIWVTISLLLMSWLISWHFQVGGRWIHLLPLAAFILVVLLIRFQPAKDIETEEDVIPQWNAEKVGDSLADIHSYVIQEAGKSIHWYWRAKRSKSFPSQIIRFSAWVLAAAGGLLPVAGSLFQKSLPGLENGLWASLLLGLAAALVGLDKAFGYSSGWARYVLTATSIRRTLEEFRLDWAELMAKSGSSPTAENIGLLVDRAKKFRIDVEALVLQETKDWVTEFQNSMVQMEKDVAAQVAALKAQVDKAAQAKEAAEQSGSIQLEIQSASKADTGTAVSVSLTDAEGKTVHENASGASWAKINVLPGQYKIGIEATVKGQRVEDQKVVSVKPGEIAPVQLTLCSFDS